MVDGSRQRDRRERAVFDLERDVVLAVAASGLNGQSFAFTGYLPVDARQRAARIQELAEELYKRLAKFGEHMAKIGRSLGLSVDAYNSAVGSLERQVLPGARKFTELGLRPEREIEEITPVEKLTRTPRTGDGEAGPAESNADA